MEAGQRVVNPTEARDKNPFSRNELSPNAVINLSDAEANKPRPPRRELKAVGRNSARRTLLFAKTLKNDSGDRIRKTFRGRG